uniref:Bestrophin homolog n=1 Tax=Panagrellus redivivus TaxID=6233 RepID=A0A7E4VLR6_PANRE
MDYLRRAYASTSSFCRSVIEWRSPATVLYVLAVNGLFWSIVFYTNRETQVQCLLATAGTIILWDILLAPTHNRSVAAQIVQWPIQDAFRTTGFISAMGAVRQLKFDEEEQAFWLATISAVSLLVGPVYKYNEITSKILQFFKGIFDFLSYMLYLIIINPSVRTYEALKYVFLLKWMPGLMQYLRSFGSNVYQFVDDWFLQYVRAMGNRTLSIAKYWVYFHWWTDLKAWSGRTIFAPLGRKLAVVWDGFVYVFGCYWLGPALQYAGRQMKAAGFIALGYFNQFLIAVGNSVLYPTAVFALDQMKQGYLIFHERAIQPVLDILYQKYKRVEDLSYIYFLGPVCETLINSVPERNPFAVEEDTNLDDFIPATASTVTSDSEFSTISGANSDDEEYNFAKGLHQIDVSDSESDNDEFLPIPRRRRRPQPQAPPPEELNDESYD